MKGNDIMIKFKCNCAMGEHKAPLENYVIEKGAIKKLCEVLKDYSKIYMVCDENTYKAAGEEAEKILTSCGKFSHKFIIKGRALPNAQTIGDILIHLNSPKADSDIFAWSPKPDIILAVGSGTVNDSCRLVSYRLGIPYAILGTAPSMDGYASAGSPILYDGTKATIKCTTPKFIIADTDIMRKAPYDMLLAGIGDMFGKYTGLLDWELARDYKNEYFCDKIAADVLDATNLCLENGYKVTERDADVISNVMNGFMVTGLGMAYTGNSRPASGSEHIVGHVWELEDIENGREPNLHGLEVCEATRLIAEMYMMLYKESDDEHLKSLIEKYIPYFEKVEKYCYEMKVPSPVKDPVRMEKSVMRALGLRDRYTILFYLNDRGLLEDYAKRASKSLCERL